VRILWQNVNNQYDATLAAFVKHPIHLDAEDELSDADRNECLLLEFPRIIQVYPVDLACVPQPAEGGVPGPGRDSRAPPSRESPCPGCKRSRVREDWERDWKIGECAYPYDKSVVPECVACQDRKQRLRESHTYEIDKCIDSSRLPSRGCFF
jgi:hypothetical protein